MSLFPIFACYPLPYERKKSARAFGELAALRLLDRIYEYPDKFGTRYYSRAQEIGDRTKSSARSSFLIGKSVARVRTIYLLRTCEGGKAAQHVRKR